MDRVSSSFVDGGGEMHDSDAREHRDVKNRRSPNDGFIGIWNPDIYGITELLWCRRPQITLVVSPELIKQAMHPLLSCWLSITKRRPHDIITTPSYLLKTEMMGSYVYYAPLPSWQLFVCRG